MADGRSGVIITYFSTASAVGKTILSINMASELARIGYDVCLLDADIQFGDAEDYLALNPTYDLADAHQALKDDPEANIEQYLTIYNYRSINFHILPSPKDLTLAYNIEPEMVGKIVEKLQRRFDFVIIDTTSMFSSLNMILLDMSTIVPFLGIVDFIPTIKNMKIGLETLRSLNSDENKLRLVLNRSDSKTKIGRRDVENLLGESFYHILPNDYKAASQSIKTAVPLVLSGAKSDLATSLRELVALYTNRSYDDSGNVNDSVDEYYEDMYRNRQQSHNDRSSGGGGWFSKLFG